MYTTLNDLEQDIDKILSLLNLAENIKEFTSVEIQETSFDTPFLENSKSVYDLARDNHSNFLILNGTLLLAIAGRFESFIRMTFEELCSNAVEMAERFSFLPKEMRENLVKYTAEVISNPRRYGHAEHGVKNFVKVLSDNLLDSEDFSEVNVSCLSITNENMRASVFGDLFKRIGINNIWLKVSEQARLQTFFEAHDREKTRKSAERFLNEIMNKRNEVAHPSSSITWPDNAFVEKSGAFVKVFAVVLIDSLTAIEFDLRHRIEEAKSRASD